MAEESTVYVVDDDAGIRNALQRLFRRAGIAVEVFDSAKGFLTGFRPEAADCLVLDLRMPEMDGLELQHELVLRKIRIPVVFLTGCADVGVAVEAMRAGAHHFLEKPFDDDELLKVVRAAMMVGFDNRSAQMKRIEIETRLQRLTPREREVLEQMTSGKINKSIADTLGLSPRTVEIHRARIMEKMGAGSLAELVRMLFDARR